MRRHRPGKRLQRNGSTLVISVVVIVMLLMIAAITVDLGYAHAYKSRMQSAADASALAAAMRIGNSNTADTRTAAKNWAIDFADYNLPDAGDVLVVDDVVFGDWDPVARAFTAGGELPDAVQVTVRRDGTNTTGLGTFFMNIFGIDELNLRTRAVATLSPAGGGSVIPMALRTPDFGDVDPAFSPVNPGKDGPSSPDNGVHFVVGEEVIVAIYGKGKLAPVHLALDIGEDGSGANPSEVMKIIRGDQDPPNIRIGDEALVFNGGTGAGNFGEQLDNRLDLPADDPGRDITMVIIETLEDSRDEGGELDGYVRVVDFAAVHLDGTVEVDVVDPKKPDRTITVKYLMGTITNKRSETFWGGSAPSGVGGRTFSVVELVQ